MKHGLYVHIPFCVRKCPYCDFLSFPQSSEGRDFSLYEKYTDTVCDQMELWREKGISVDTVFFGGGTPTLIGAENLCKILEKAYACFQINDDAEITTEANPGTVDQQMLYALRKAGFKRISFGVQSFDDATLKTIGRIHNAREAEEAVQMAKAAGFTRISIDLISALPNQSMDSLMQSVDKAIALGITHISCYDLIIADDTPFAKAVEAGTFVPLDDDNAVLMQRAVAEKLEAAGFEHYEISNYAKDGHISRHNMHYWKNDPYVGIGCGAYGRLENIRYHQADTLQEYADDVTSGKLWHAVDEEVTAFDIAFETFMLGMRLKEGVQFDAIVSMLDAETASEWKKKAEKFIRMGLLQIKNGRLCATPKGFEVQNAWLCEFL
ncbi:MAG: radical SAM family heme chaperone HemW [Clostridia bacterium]|nr:radical SAM family heme chaperone HemW [Clostridia bacterium]